MELNIEQILQSERAWEYVLLDIVKSEDLDPWDIDVVKLTETYLERIHKMKDLDLRIPARIILAASMLLKMQSDLLMPHEEEEALEEALLDFELMGPAEEEDEDEGELSLLDLRIRRKPERKITLDDLVSTLSKSMEPKPPKLKTQQFVLDLPEVDVTQQIEMLYEQILSKKEKKIPFSELTPSNSPDDVVDTLLPILYLANEHKIDLEQDTFFKDFYVLKKN